MSAENRQAMLKAYIEVTGFRVTMSQERYQTLREMDARGFTAEDVAGVLRAIKAAMENGVKGFTATSLQWRNCMGVVDTFEERALVYRQRAARRKGAKREASEATPRRCVTRLPDGSTVERLASDPEERPVPLIDVKKGLQRLMDEIEGGRDGS